MKKGFTLIELLAVIVILAVIAIIAVPIIINIIDDARKNAAIQSANGYVRAVNYKIAQSVLHDEETLDGEYTIGENSLSVTANNVDDIEGQYTVLNNRVLFAGLCINNYSIEYNSATGYTGISTASDYCTGESLPEFVEPEGEYVSAACTDSAKYTNTTNFKIKTVEDLVCFSQLTNNSKNFSGKNVYLVNDIDFNNNDSYSNPTTIAYGDINGDNTTDGLKTELTTGKGFKPIGSFEGNFNGNAFTISNLMINRTSEYMLGLFTNISGTVQGLKMRGASVSAGSDGTNSFAGILAGTSSNSTIKNIDIQGTVTGTGNCVGGIIGYGHGNINLSDFVVKATVQGNTYVGGVMGRKYQNSISITGVVYDSIVSGSFDVGKSNGGIAPTLVMVSSSTTRPQGSGGSDGTQYTTANMIVFDKVLDTYIAGDTDDDGYYFDFDSNGIITLYSTNRNPIQVNKLRGSGTEENPYLITKIDDWKLATATINETTPYYYSVTANLDFTDQLFYPMGTAVNKFYGVFDGNNYNISNVSVSGYDYVGLFGYSQGTIKNLSFNNISITSTADRAGIVSNLSNGTLDGIVARNVTVTAGSDGTNSFAGVLSGVVDNSTIKNIDIQGTITGTGNCVGGIIGYGHENIDLSDFVIKATVQGNTYVGGVMGRKYQNSISITGVVYDSIVSGSSNVGKSNGGIAPTLVMVSSSTTRPQGSGGSDGTEFTNITLEAVNSAIDTTIGGDNDSDGYYFTLTNGEYQLIQAE